MKPSIPLKIVQSFNRSIVQSFNRSIVQSFNRSIVQSFNRSIVQSFNRSIVQSFNRSIVQSFNRSIVQSFNRSIVQSFNRSIVQSFNRSIVQSFNRSIVQSFNRSIVQSFNRSIVQSFNRSIVQSFNRSIVQSFNRSIVQSFNRSIVQSFNRSIVQSFNRSIVQSFNRSIVQSFNRSIVQSFNRSIVQSFNRSIVQSFNRSIVQSFNRSIVQSFNRSIVQSNRLFIFLIFLFLTGCVEQNSTSPKATPKKVTISFDSLGGTPVPDQEVTFNSMATLPSAPTRTGFNFIDWFTSSTDTNDAFKFNFDTLITNDLTLYAGWQPIPLTVSFDSLDGSPVATQTVYYESMATEPVAPTHAFSNFRGWFTDPATTTRFFFTNLITNDLTLYASWQGKEFSISFDSLGGSVVAPQTVVYNNLGAEPVAPTHAFSNFIGWFTDPATTTPFFFTTPITNDLTLYASWQGKEFSISFDSLGGSIVAPQTVVYNNLGAEPVAPTHAVSNFKGWFTDPAAITRFFFTTPITNHLTLYAGWKEKSLLTIIFNSLNGTPVPDQEVTSNSMATLPSAPTRTGFIFIDWFTNSTETNDAFDFDTLITNDLTLYAGWQPIPLTVSFDSLDGSPVATQTAYYESMATEPTAPTHAFSNFRGWFTDPTTTTPFFFTTPITSDLTLYAGWEGKKFTISFDSLGGSPVATQTVVYNNLGTEPVAPTHAFSNFRGWFTDPATTTPFLFTTPITSDLTLYASWEGKKFTISFESLGGSPVAAQTVVYNNLGAEPAAPTRTGFNFIDWFTNSTETNDAFDFDTLITNDLTLYAGWQPIPLTVSFDSLGGGTVESQTTRYGQTTTRPNDPTTNNNWLLYHWYTQAPSTPDDLYNTNLIFQFSTLITNHLTLYAGYRQRPANRAELLTIVNKAITDNGDNANLNFIDTSLITDMNSLFNKGPFTPNPFNGKIDKWDVSSVTNMSKIFYYANRFNQEIGEWDVSKVQDMSSMFERAENFNKNITNWNVSSVTNMEDMFTLAPSFNQEIGGWDVSKVQDMRSMFNSARNFNQEIGEWDVSKVQDMRNMFGEADNFNKNITNWNVSSVTNMSSMFGGADAFNQEIGGWDVSKVQNMNSMFAGADAFNQEIGRWDVSKVQDMRNMFYTADNFNQNLEKWTISSAADIGNMFIMSGVASTGNYPTWCTTKRGCRY